MHRNKVGPATQVHQHTMWKSGRVQSGMSMEDLKHQTALRLANEQRDDPSNDEANDGYRPQQPYGGVQAPPPPMNSPQYQSHAYNQTQSYNYQQQPQQYDSRNYTNSPLGIAVHHQHQQQPSQSQSHHYSASTTSRQTAAYSTPRNKHALQDRGSAENRSLDGENAEIVAALHHHHHPVGSHKTPLKSGQHQQQRVGSNSSLKSAGTSHSLKKKSAAGKAKDGKDGRVTPVKDAVEPQRILYSTPNTRRELTTSTPTSVYSEPNTRIKAVPSSSNNRSPRPNHHRSTPDYHKRSNNPTNTPANTPYNTYKVNTNTGGGGSSSQQSKLPHGLTVQELKEMTRARLAAEANYEAEESVHTSGSGEERNSPNVDVYLQPPPTLHHHTSDGYMTFRKGSADGANSIGSNGNLTGYGQGGAVVQQHHQGHGPVPHSIHPSQQHHIQHSIQQQQGHMPHPRMQVVQAASTASPHPSSSGPSMHYPYPCHPSPVYHVQKPRTDTWENSSSASEYQVPDLLYPPSSQGGVPSFSSPREGGASMNNFNRGRCFSAGATVSSSHPLPSSSSGPYETSSWEEQTNREVYRPNTTGMYYDRMAEESNPPRCATMSPPGMSRLHEDRPFLFSGEDKDRLAVPPLSEPRPRFHTTGVLLGNSSAFEPISAKNTIGGSGSLHPHHHPRGSGPPSPPSFERVKFNIEDRMMSTGSNGDLPSSVAEAVLESLTASSGPMMDLFDSNSTYHSFVGDGSGKSPFRKSSSQEYSLERIVTESSGSGSLFSGSGGGGGGASSSQKSFFSTSNDYYTNDRMLSVTNSWGGEVENNDNSASFGFSQEFNNLLIGSDGPALRGRAQTAPCFGENHLFVGSKLDPEHRLEDNSANCSSNRYDSAPMMLGFGRSTNLPPGFDKPSGSG